MNTGNEYWGGGMTLAPIQLMAVILKMQIPLRPMQQITNSLPLFMHFIRSPNTWTSLLTAVECRSLMSFTTTTSSELVTPGAAPATRLFAEAMVCFDANLAIRSLETVRGRFLDLGRGGCLWEEPKGRESIQQ